jgi:hypothetical protein
LRLLTDDGKFGFLVAATPSRGMLRFQVIIEGHLIGDSEPCILGTAVKQLGNRPRLEDKRLGALSVDPYVVLSALRADEYLHDLTTMSLAESLDHWVINGYFYEGNFVMLAQAYDNNEPTDLPLIAVVDAAEYISIVDAVRSYWLKAGRGDG